jgi:hypothetical protein
MELFIYSLVIGFLLSVPWGLASWFKWQNMKNGTILPAGAFTEKYGSTVGYIINAICIGVALSFFSKLSWWLIFSIAIFLYLGGWIATLIERKLYCSQFQLDTIVYAAKKYKRLTSVESAAEILTEVAPKWWIKLMPFNWQQQLREELSKINLPDNNGNHENR